MDKKTVFAMMLIALIIIVWPFYIKLVSPPPDETVTIPERGNILVDTVRATAQDTVTVRPDTVRSRKSAAVEKQPAALLPQLWTDASEKTVSIQTALYDARLSNRGGRIVAWSLRKYRDFHGNEVSFVDTSRNLNIRFLYHNRRVNLADAVFAWESADSVVDLRAADKASLRLKLVFDQTHTILLTYTFYRDFYHFDYDVVFENFGDEIINNEYNVEWLTGLQHTEKDTFEDANYFKTYALLGDEKQEFDVKDQASEETSFTGLTHWIGSRTKYFVLYIIPQHKHGTGCRFLGSAVMEGGHVIQKNYALSMSMKLESGKNDQFKVYLGPTDFKTLNSYDEDLTVILEWGWAIMRPLTKAILYTFNFLYGLIPNYGWVIILFTFIVKIILYPLTHKSYVGMQKMKEVMPRQKEIQKKFKDNPTKMQQEMMKLYKEIGYNPLSGCLPMLIQMPILFPIYQVFHESIDLRQAPFFGWIKDLSVPDTVAVLHTGLPLIGTFHVNPLPIIMTILTFVQQRIAPMTPMGDASDPSQRFNQKFMMYGMPLMFFFIFNNFSSGLVLYWTVFNVLTMIQQSLMAKHVIK